ncbi:hypothetical protein B0O80DRAFT_439109 [Mortierella sp. GBAus27b]|nr:hypothetical protein B0O80DRAFT_439109 [Mortierella sp. GBAus27b]
MFCHRPSQSHADTMDQHLWHGSCYWHHSSPHYHCHNLNPRFHHHPRNRVQLLGSGHLIGSQDQVQVGFS